MSKVDEIKAAAKNLPAADKLDLYRWLDDSEEVRAMRLAELRREIQKGIDSLERGNFTTYDEHSLDSMAEGIKRRGREKLGQQIG